MPEFGTFDLGQIYSVGEGIKNARMKRDYMQKDMQWQEEDRAAELKQRVENLGQHQREFLAVAVQHLGGAASDPKLFEIAKHQFLATPAAGDLLSRLGLKPEDVTPENVMGVVTAAEMQAGVAPEKAPARKYEKVGDTLLDVSGDKPTVAYSEPDKPEKPDKANWTEVDKVLDDGTVQKGLIDKNSPNPEATFRPIGSPANPSASSIPKLRKEFRQLPSVKAYEETLPLLVSARKAPDNGYGDMQLIYTAGKLLDPGSVVREGEIGLMIKAGSPIERLVGATEFYANKGGRLTAKSRQQLLGMLNERVLAYRAAYDRDFQQYQQYAAEMGLNPTAVVGKHAANAYQGGQTLQPTPAPKKPSAIYRTPGGATVEVMDE